MKGLLAMLPFFSDKQSVSTVEKKQEDSLGRESETKEITGVSKYVNSLPVVTGVDKYLGRQEDKIVVYQGLTKVEKYLNNVPKKLALCLI